MKVPKDEPSSNTKPLSWSFLPTCSNCGSKHGLLDPCKPRNKDPAKEKRIWQEQEELEAKRKKAKAARKEEETKENALKQEDKKKAELKGRPEHNQHAGLQIVNVSSRSSGNVSSGGGDADIVVGVLCAFTVAAGALWGAYQGVVYVAEAINPFNLYYPSISLVVGRDNAGRDHFFMERSSRASGAMTRATQACANRLGENAFCRHTGTGAGHRACITYGYLADGYLLAVVHKDTLFGSGVYETKPTGVEMCAQMTRMGYGRVCLPNNISYVCNYNLP